MGRHNQSIGSCGEHLALQVLCSQGWELVCKNWRCRAGELDLVMRDGVTLVFLEVKSRLDRPGARRHIFDNVGWSKQRQLRRLAELYLLKRYGRRRWPAVRIDVIGVLLDKNTQELVKIEHLRGVV